MAPALKSPYQKMVESLERDLAASVALSDAANHASAAAFQGLPQTAIDTHAAEILALITDGGGALRSDWQDNLKHG